MTGSLAPGTLLGDRYRIVRLIAEGGMGAVYEAQHLALDRRVALKTLLSEFQEEPRLIQRFVREARATCTIAHPNVVSVLDIDQTADGVIFFVMEYLEGRDLGELLETDGRLPWQRVREIALQMCAALEAAHDRGIVHRDLKPSNCFLVGDDGDHVKLLDFGVAKVLESSGRTGPHGARRDAGRALRWLRTSTGEVFGTLAYMAPEHLNGDPHDHRVDIYALGVILYEALTGAPPFSPDAPGTFVQQVLYDVPVPPSQRVPGLPPDLDYVVLRALEKRPEDRFADMREFADALATVRQHAAPAIAASPLGWTAGPIAPLPTIPAAPRPARTEPAPATPRPRLAVFAALAILGALAFALVLRSASNPAESPASAPVGSPAIATPLDPPQPLDPASELTVAPTPEPAVAPALEPPVAPALEPPVAPAPEPAEPSALDPAEPAPAEPPTARTTTKSSRPTPRPRELPAMTVSHAERQVLLAGHRDAIARQCKQPRRLGNALLVLQVTLEDARIVRATIASTDRDRRAAARCIEKYLRTQVKVPAHLSGRAVFSYAF